MNTRSLVVLAWVAGLLFSLAAGPSVHAADPAPGTKVQNVSTDDAAKLVEAKKVTVLDIRTPAEFATGHIAGAVNVDYNSPDFAKKVAELDRTKPYLVHCAAGGRSAKSLKQFESLKFETIYHYKGGFRAWEKDGKPVAK